MERMEQMAKMYLDWWESYWEQAFLVPRSIEEMQRFWASWANTCEEFVRNSTDQV